MLVPRTVYALPAAAVCPTGSPPLSRTRAPLRPALIFVAALCLATFASAATRISVGDIKGDRKGAISKALTAELCSKFECVPFSKIATKRRVDWRKARKLTVAAVFTGTVGKVKRVPTVTLELGTAPGPAAQRWQFPLRAGKLAGASLRQVRSDTDALLGGSTPEPAATTPDTTARPVTPEPAPPSGANAPSATEPSTPPPAERAAESSPAAVSPEPAAKSTLRKAALVSVELGSDFLNRNLKYSGLSTANLRTYAAPLIFAPHAHVELFPLTTVADNLLAGLGVEADFAIAVGLKSAVSGGAAHPTSYSRLDFALAWRLPVGPIFTLIPKVGYRISSFTVGPASDGSTFTGLPKLTDNGLKVGANIEAAFGEHQNFIVFVGGEYLPSVSGKDLISAAYFVKGKETGLDFEGGVGVELVKNFQVRAALMYQRYSYVFTAADGDTYVATGASDVYLGGRLMLRYSF